jgi:hypothetical protein
MTLRSAGSATSPRTVEELLDFWWKETAWLNPQ